MIRKVFYNGKERRDICVGSYVLDRGEWYYVPEQLVRHSSEIKPEPVDISQVPPELRVMALILS